MRRLIFLVLCMLPPAAAAHGDADAHHWWTLDPWIWLPMLILSALYARGVYLLRSKNSPARSARPYAVAGFSAGMAALFFALIWPLDALGSISFAAHMAQHMLLIAVAAPLIALAEPAAPILQALPASWRHANASLGVLHQGLQILLRPRIAFALHGFVIWIWHAPLLFEWALRWEWVHVLEHVSFLGSALLFWTALQHSGRGSRNSEQGYGAAALWTLATLMHTGLLGALLTFAPRLLYPIYADVEGFGLSPLEDQQLAGLLMWIPAGLCYLIAGLAYAALWLHSSEQRGSTARSGRGNAVPPT